MRGEALKLLQATVGTVPDGAFGPNTARKICGHYRLSSAVGAHLLGQCHHESAGFQITEENLNYSSEALMRVWPHRFPSIGSTAALARNPEAMANNVYANRMGNGDEASGDGYKFRGKGFIQLTGRDNTTRFADAINRPGLVEDPSPITTKFAFLAALWFFDVNGLMRLAEDGVNDSVIGRVTKRVNGGHTGLDDRIVWTKKIHGWLTS